MSRDHLSGGRVDCGQTNWHHSELIGCANGLIHCSSGLLVRCTDHVQLLSAVATDIVDIGLVL